MSQQDILLYIMTVFVVVSAIALCVQMGTMLAMYKAVQKLQQEATSVMPQVKSILTKAEDTVDQSKRHIIEITAKGNEMMDLGRAQLVKLDSVLTDASSRAHAQLERAEMVVDDTVSRVHQSVAAVHNGVMRPVREIHGVAAGIRMAVSYFLKGGRPSVAQVTQDDEMFI